MSDPSRPEAPIQSQATTMIRTVVSRERFDSVPRKRAIYILLYVSSFALYMCQLFYSMSVEPDIEEMDTTLTTAEGEDAAQPVRTSSVEDSSDDMVILPAWIRVVRTLIAICLGLFYVPFISVLRIMGYPWVGILAFCGFALAPIPGLLIVAYLDTRIAKAWNIADLRYQDSIAAAGGSG